MCDAELILELPTASLAEIMPTNKEGEAQMVIRITPAHLQNDLKSTTTQKTASPGIKASELFETPDNLEYVEGSPHVDLSSTNFHTNMPNVSTSGPADDNKNNQNDDDQEQQQQEEKPATPSAINIISIIPTEAQVIETQDEIGLEGSKHQVQPTPAAPILFILAGEYKIPLRSEVPVISITTEGTIPGIQKAYQFDVLGLQLQIQFPENTPRLTIQHFEEILIMQHCLKTFNNDNTYTYQSPQQLNNNNNGTSGGGYVQPQWDMPEQGSSLHKEGSTTRSIVKGVDSVGTGVARGLRSGAVVLASGITSATQFIVSKTDKTNDPIAVPESWSGGVKTARIASKGAVKVSTGVAKSLIGVSSIVTDVIAAKLRTVIKKDDKDEDPDSDTVRSLKLIGIASADQAVSLYEAATDSARTILTATCAGICSVVEHKLGDEAGNFAEDGLGLVQDTYDASKAVGSVGAKGILRKSIKATAVKTFKEDP